MNELRAEVRHENETSVIELHGDINGGAETALGVAWTAAGEGDPRAVLLNFAGVDYMNSTGIALIVGLLAEARKANRAVLVCGLSDHFRHIFEITRLADFMSFYPDEEAAIHDGLTPSP